MTLSSSPLHWLKVLWNFSRPHTIIGSFLSITTLYLIATIGHGLAAHWVLYGWTLLAALGCNVYITGLNQLTDVEMDRINKPFLPLASGALAIRQGQWIIAAALLVALGAAWAAHYWILANIAVIVLVGTLYSVPPFRLKRHHLSAAFCIVLVRGVLVNLAMGAALDWIVDERLDHWTVWLLLTAFLSAFSLAIAWFKDLYDTEGDEVFAIKTLPLVASLKSTFWWGNFLVAAAYVYALLRTSGFKHPYEPLLFWGHAVLLVGFVLHAVRANIQTREGIYRFYMGFWVFFFAEYLLFIGYGALAHLP